MHPTRRRPPLAAPVAVLAVFVAVACGTARPDATAPSADATAAVASAGATPTMSAGPGPATGPGPSADTAVGAGPDARVTASPTAPPDEGPPPSTFAYDTGEPLDPRIERRSRTTADARIEWLTYAGGDGERVPALFAVPRDARLPLACVIVGHGFRGDKESFPIWDMLGRVGFATFAIDARSHGQRRDAAVLDQVATDPALLADMLRQTVIDMRRGIDYLATRTECDPERIGYVGASMGGFLGSMLAGADVRVQAPVLLVSGADWETMLGSEVAQRFRREASPQDVERAREVLDPVDAKHWIGRISPRPVLMVNGDRDTSVPPDSARALHRAAREPKQVVWYEGGHAIPSGAERDRVLGIVGLWLLRHLSAP